MAQISRTNDAEIENGNVIDADDLDAEFDNLISESNSQDTRITTLESGDTTITGVKTFSSTPKMNAIAERTADTGVTVDSVLLKDGALRVPGSAGYTPGTNGDFGYDSTAHQYKGYQNGAGVVFSLGMPVIRVYTADDTWTNPTGLIGVEVIVVGGGGGGGGVSTTSDRFGLPGGGGGACIKWIAAASLSATEAVTVGEAGAAGSTAGGNGGNGETSSFGSHCSATGGTGGNGGQSVINVGGAGGAGSDGNLNFTGSQGETVVNSAGNYVLAGKGGDAGGGFGAGGNGIKITSGSQAGNAGSGYGGGGSGAVIVNGGVARAGGAGAAGVVIVKEYF